MRLNLIFTLCLSLFFKQILAQDESFNYEVDPSTVHDTVDVKAEYIGGESALLKYVADNLEYPSICKENGITGVVKVTFVVDVDGKVKDARVIRKADPNLDAEALRVVKSLGDFEPGVLKGKKVPVCQTIPIRFHLNQKSSDDTGGITYLPTGKTAYKKERKDFIAPKFPGGESALYSFVSKNVEYPAIAIENGITDSVDCKLTIDELGSVRDVIVTNLPDPFIGKAAVNVLENLPAFIPGNTATQYATTIKFRLTKGDPIQGYQTVNPHAKLVRFELLDYSGGDYYTIVETMPEYPGGDKALLDFLVKNMRYPVKAKEMGITGIVYVGYIVDKDGSIKDVKVVRGAHPYLDEEAIRVVNLIENYVPGTQDGKPVPVQFTIPLRFVMDGYSSSSPHLDYKAKAAYDSAKTAMSNSDFTNAIRLYTESISLDPNNYVPYYERAIAHYAKEQFNQAELDFAEVLKMRPRHYETYLYRGTMRYESGKTQYALEDLSEAIKIDKQSFDAYLARGKCHAGENDLKSARNDLEKALKISPDNMEVMLNLGIVTYTEGAFDKALKHFSKVVKLYPETGKAYYFIGMCYARMRDMDQACQNLIKAKELGVKDAELLVQSQCSGQ